MAHLSIITYVENTHMNSILTFILEIYYSYFVICTTKCVYRIHPSMRFKKAFVEMFFLERSSSFQVTIRIIKRTQLSLSFTAILTLLWHFFSITSENSGKPPQQKFQEKQPTEGLINIPIDQKIQLKTRRKPYHTYLCAFLCVSGIYLSAHFAIKEFDVR